MPSCVQESHIFMWPYLNLSILLFAGAVCVVCTLSAVEHAKQTRGPDRRQSAHACTMYRVHVPCYSTLGWGVGGRARVPVFLSASQ